jgi:hypothetical protein
LLKARFQQNRENDVGRFRIMSSINRNLVAALATVWLLPSRCHAVAQRVWPEGEEPNAVVRWWVNGRLAWGSLFPIFICLVVVIVVATAGLSIRLYRKRHKLSARRKRAYAISAALVVTLLGALWWFWGLNVHLLQKDSYWCRPSSGAVLSHGCVSPGLGNIVLIRPATNGVASAIRYDRMTDSRGVEYTSWVCDQRQQVALSDIHKNEGHAFHRYWMTRITWTRGKMIQTGNPWFSCGDLEVSLNLQSAGLCIPSNMYVAVVTNDATSPLDFHSPHLQWYKSPFVPDTFEWNSRKTRKVPAMKRVDVQQMNPAYALKGAADS